MAIQTFIQFPNVNGDSKERVHLGWFDVHVWNKGDRPLSKDVRFRIDAGASGVSDLVKHVSTGEPFGKVTLDAARENGSLYFRIEFSEVLLTDFESVQSLATFGFKYESLKTLHYDVWFAALFPPRGVKADIWICQWRSLLSRNASPPPSAATPLIP